MLTVKTLSISVTQGLGNKIRQDSLERDGVPSRGDRGHLSPAAVLTAHDLSFLETLLGMVTAEAMTLPTGLYPQSSLNAGRWPIVSCGHISSDCLMMSFLIHVEGEQD